MTVQRAPADRAGRDLTPLRVHLAIVDFPMLASSFRSVIEAEPDMTIAGETTERGRVTEDLVAVRPDVVVTACDPVDGFGCSTYAAIEAIHAAAPDTKIITLDCRCAADQLQNAFRAGANGYLTRETQGADVVAAIRSVAAGHTYVSPAIVTQMVNTFVRRDGSADDPYDSLTDREREILLLAAMGHTSRDIARSLHLSEQTVHYHRANMMEKLGLRDRVELLRYSVRRGLLNPSTL
ncbi:MAG TPA: response regulator transcription factor [Candidatus Limnocylindrales bacterium]|nr:response regulator transcription factor [Candidatus Limnocylindrales bacterium]